MNTSEMPTQDRINQILNEFENFIYDVQADIGKEDLFKMDDLEKELHSLCKQLNEGQLEETIYKIVESLDRSLTLLKYQSLEMLPAVPDDMMGGYLLNPSRNSMYYENHFQILGSIPHPIALKFLIEQYCSHPDQLISMEALMSSTRCAEGILRLNRDKTDERIIESIQIYFRNLFSALYDNQSHYLREQARRTIHMNVNGTNMNFPNTPMQEFLWQYGADQMIKFIGDTSFSVRDRSSLLRSVKTCVEKLKLSLNDDQVETLLINIESLVSIEGYESKHDIESSIIALSDKEYFSIGISDVIVDHLVQNISVRAEDYDYRQREYIAETIDAMKGFLVDKPQLKRKLLPAITILSQTITFFEESEEKLSKAIVDFFNHQDYFFFTPEELTEYVKAIKLFDKKQKERKAFYDSLVAKAGYKGRQDLRRPTLPAEGGIRDLQYWFTKPAPKSQVSDSAETKRNNAHKAKLHKAYLETLVEKELEAKEA